MKIINSFNNKNLDPHSTQPVISTQGARNTEISLYSILHIASSYCADTKQMAPQGLKTEICSSGNWAYNVQTVRNPLLCFLFSLPECNRGQIKIPKKNTRYHEIRGAILQIGIRDLRKTRKVSVAKNHIL